MNILRRLVLWSCIAGFVVISGFYFLQRAGSIGDDSRSAGGTHSPADSAISDIQTTSSVVSPFEPENTRDAPPQASSTSSDQSSDQTVSDINGSLAGISPDVTRLGREPLGDEDFLQLIERLSSDPSAVDRLVDEIRQETDLQRLKQLTWILGEVGGEPATLLASEYIFSGDENLRTLGLDLLQDVQPGNPEARDIVAGMLATEVEPDVLVNTLTTLADPGEVDDQSRQYLADQVAWLTDHPDASVRSVSLDILSRWTNDGTYTDVLLNGLDDESQYVRASAAFALVDHKDRNQRVIDRLFVTANDSSEINNVRQAAVLALSRMPLTDLQREDLGRIRQALNTVRR